MAYATPNDMLVYADWNTIGDLVSDDGSQVEASVLTDSTSAYYTLLNTLLSAASGRVDSACLVAGMYSAGDLAGLGGNALAMLKEITCKLALVLLVRRRPEKIGADFWKVAQEEVENFLDRLRKGERLFGTVTDAINGGLPTIDGPTLTTYQNMNTLRVRANRFYPNIGDELPIGRSY